MTDAVSEAVGHDVTGTEKPSDRQQGVTILGSTGSIGQSTLDVISRHPERYRVHALAAHTSVDALFEQCKAHRPDIAAIGSEADAAKLRQLLSSGNVKTSVVSGASALDELASDDGSDVVVAAIVGAAGLMSTLAAAKAGKRLLLANKESLVMSGDLLMNMAKQAGALLMPVDSEHNAIFQSLPATKTGVSTEGIKKILLTASGGPLRQCTLEQLRVVSVQQALKHPNWSMGPKISIDSATLMNKGLEVIEACQLFAVSADDIDVVVHPESIIHSMVSYQDGSVIAQMGQPDMRTPIAHALAWPDRIDSGVAALDFMKLSGLHFEEPDTTRFPLLRLAFEAQREGGTAPTVLNAANEVAVDAFLHGDVAFLQLMEVVEQTLHDVKISPAIDLDTIIAADKNARAVAQKFVTQHARSN